LSTAPLRLAASAITAAIELTRRIPREYLPPRPRAGSAIVAAWQRALNYRAWYLLAAARRLSAAVPARVAGETELDAVRKALRAERRYFAAHLAAQRRRFTAARQVMAALYGDRLGWLAIRDGSTTADRRTLDPGRHAQPRHQLATPARLHQHRRSNPLGTRRLHPPTGRPRSHITRMRSALANAERTRLREVAKAAGRARDRKARQEALDAIAKLPPWKRPTGPNTKHRIREVLRNALKGAMVAHGLTVNVAKLIELESAKRSRAVVWTAERTDAHASTSSRSPRPGRQQAAAGSRFTRSGGPWWTPEQTGVFLEYATRHRLYAAYHLIAFTGLRRSEACGAAWQDLDFAGRQLAIRVGRVQIGWQVEEDDPKSESSSAPVALDAANCRRPQPHFSTREDGAALHPSTLSNQFDRLAFEAGLPRIRLHDLRHGAATLALAAGVEMKVISAMLRHSSTSITADIYTSVLPDVAREAAEAVAAMVPRKAAGGESGTLGLPSGSQPPKSLITKIASGEKGQVKEGAPGSVLAQDIGNACLQT
jgi:integrase